MAKEIWELEEREPTERELFLADSRKRFEEHINRVDDMILTVLKAQIAVERCMSSILLERGIDPKHFLFTAGKIKECKKIEPALVSKEIWELFEKCTHVRNELAHSLDDDLVAKKSELVREAYIATTESEVQKQSYRDMNHTQVVTSAFYYCGLLIMLASENGGN